MDKDANDQKREEDRRERYAFLVNCKRHPIKKDRMLSEYMAMLKRHGGRQGHHSLGERKRSIIYFHFISFLSLITVSARPAEQCKDRSTIVVKNDPTGASEMKVTLVISDNDSLPVGVNIEPANKPQSSSVVGPTQKHVEVHQSIVRLQKEWLQTHCF